MWTHLSRQTGGIGTRGPGETQLEVDRRRVQERIARLERDLRGVRKNRTVQREGRLRRNWPVASLVGYTNAGKSSLLNSLTGAGVPAEDKLFGTLDPTTRQLMLPNKQKVLLTDTVGFIRKLPHTVIESFKATLEEVQLADLLIHVVDLSHSQYREQMAAVDETVAELGADDPRVGRMREDVRLGDAKGNLRRVEEQLEKLRESDGVAGNRQVMSKKEYQNADKPAAPTASGGVRYKDEKGKEVETKSIANIGRRTFFQKNKVWQEADVPDDVKAREVKFFSDEFFKLLEEHPDLNQIATLDGDLILKVKDGYVMARR
jgi:ABC-type branched-subunit amino acid transport system ATPase component